MNEPAHRTLEILNRMIADGAQLAKHHEDEDGVDLYFRPSKLTPGAWASAAVLPDGTVEGWIVWHGDPPRGCWTLPGTAGWGLS